VYSRSQTNQGKGRPEEVLESSQSTSITSNIFFFSAKEATDSVVLKVEETKRSARQKIGEYADKTCRWKNKGC